LINGLQKKFADKNETKKALQALERQIKNLMELIMKKQNQNTDTAMFAKKPLQGWSCASCEKNLINLQGQMAVYNSWNKLPLRDPNERIAKVGSGFSKMLAMLKPENMSKFRQTSRSTLKQRLTNDSNPDYNKGNEEDNEEYIDENEEEQNPRPSSSHLPSINTK